jgi:hypothetical protein
VPAIASAGAIVAAPPLSPLSRLALVSPNITAEANLDQRYPRRLAQASSNHRQAAIGEREQPAVAALEIG